MMTDEEELFKVHQNSK